MKNKLTNRGSRLSGETSARRHNPAVLEKRRTLRKSNLKETISQMLARFNRDRERMAKETRAEVAEFMSDLTIAHAAVKSRLAHGRAHLKETISQMLVGFHRDREQMAKETRIEVGEFMRHFRDAHTASAGSCALLQPRDFRLTTNSNL